jgi:flavin-dependent thymidylate synthase
MTTLDTPVAASRAYALAPSVAVVGAYPSPEGVAAGLARISRDATPIPELVRQAVEDTTLARRRNENIIYEYGHSSIAEGAVFGVAIEGIPRALSIDLVSHRLASYTQLSYRYVPVEKVPLRFFLPEEFRAGRARAVFDHAVERSWDLYVQMYERMTAHLLDTGQNKGQVAARRRATEDARYVLPLAQSTNLGMTANARTWGHVISRLLSHPLSEGRALGALLKDTLQPLAPSLFPDKYIHALAYPGSALDALAARAAALPIPSMPIHSETSSYPSRDGVTLLDYDPAAEEKLVAALLFRVTDLDGARRAALTAALTPEERDALLRDAFAGIGAHDTALRAFETISYTFELTQSEACYHQFIRHRLSTQLAQPRTTALGYTVPPLVEAAGCLDLYREGMAVLEDAFAALGGDERASIILGNGHNRRTLLSLNARELIELSRLRADKHAQWDVRDRTAAIVALVDIVHPGIAWACGGRDAFKAGVLSVSRWSIVDGR